jgi:hypothetical protein
MALRDTNCYTLFFVPSTSDPSITEVVEELFPPGKTRKAKYARLRECKEGETYSSGIYGESLGCNS